MPAPGDVRLAKGRDELGLCDEAMRVAQPAAQEDPNIAAARREFEGGADRALAIGEGARRLGREELQSAGGSDRILALGIGAEAGENVAPLGAVKGRALGEPGDARNAARR